MAIGGNPERLRDLARDLRREAGIVDDVRTRVLAGNQVSWQGPAGERFRERLTEHGLKTQRTSDLFDEAAAQMTDLADTLEARQRAIAIATAKVWDAVEDARSTLGRYAGMAWDALTDRETGIVKGAERLLDNVGDLPAPGAPEWTEVARRLGL